MIILAIQKESDIENLLSFLGIPKMIQEKFTNQIEKIQTLIDANVIDEIILELKDFYDLYFAEVSINSSSLNDKQKLLFQNSFTPEVLVGIDLLLLLGVNKDKFDYLIEHPEYREKTKTFIRSYLAYLKDHHV